MPVRASLTLAAVVALVGFSVVTASSTARERQVREAPRRAELVKLIEKRRSLVAELDGSVAKLRAELAEEQGRATQLTARDRRLATQATELAKQAGTIGLTGRAVVVQLNDSDRTPPAADEAGAYRIHDADLQLVVNALFASGAEAVSINGSRLVATTPIRSAGDTIVVNFRPLSPPYEVVAIGAELGRFDDSAISKRFRRWTKLFGLSFKVEQRSKAMVPAYTGRVSIAAADPMSSR